MNITIVAPKYYRENLRLQPWRSLHEIAKYLINHGNKVIVVTDGYPMLQRSKTLENVPVIHLQHIKHFPPKDSNVIVKEITATSPDVVLWLTGLTSFFQKDVYKKIKCGIIALVTSPLYSIGDFLGNIGAIEAFRYRKILMTNLAETIVPRSLIRSTLNLDNFRYVVTMSMMNKQKLQSIGVKAEKLIFIPPGTDSFFLEQPRLEDIQKTRNEICNKLDDSFIVTYFGPPLTIRGIDTILFAAKLILKKTPNAINLRILILSREQNQESRFYLTRLLKLINKLGLQRIIEIKHDLLDQDSIKKHIAASDLIALPFKLVVSDTPLSIMESMCLGKLVLSTNLDGIPELLGNNRGITIEPGNYKQLAEILMHYASKREIIADYGKRAREYMINHTTWQDSASSMLALFEKITKG